MPNRAQAKRTTPTPEQRKQRLQQIVFTVMAIILILSWIASLLVK